MTVAITGATGVVGSAVLRHLLREGHQVRALVRKRGLVPDQVTEVVGDVLDPPSIGPALSGVTTVFHLAGVNELCSRNPDRMRRVNVEGTANVLAAAASNQVKFVHTSSAAVLGETEGTVGSEETQPSQGHLSAYAASKWEAEQLVRRGSRASAGRAGKPFLGSRRRPQHRYRPRAVGVAHRAT